MGVCRGTEGVNFVVRREEAASEENRSLIARLNGVSGLSYALVALAPVGGLELKKSMMKTELMLMGRRKDYRYGFKLGGRMVAEGARGRGRCGWRDL